MSAGPDCRGRAATWTILRLPGYWDGSWPALAFAGRQVAGVGGWACRAEALCRLASRMVPAGELGTRGIQ